jgi:hypothetical protein
VEKIKGDEYDKNATRKFFSCAKVTSSTILLLFCYLLNYGFFFWPAQVVWQGVISYKEISFQWK